MTSDIALSEHTQRQKTLSAIAWTALITSVALGLYDIQFGTWVSVIALFALGLFCVPDPHSQPSRPASAICPAPKSHRAARHHAQPV